MREMEGHTKQYSALHCHAEQLSSRYKPSGHLEGKMASMQERWAGFVASMEHHSGEKQALKGRWEEYEREVKGLLGWMTQEANRFSREVTEKGEKGIEDHVQSCQVSCLVPSPLVMGRVCIHKHPFAPPTGVH
jgi:hypothetical protein